MESKEGMRSNNLLSTAQRMFAGEVAKLGRSLQLSDVFLMQFLP